ncbi:MAG: hypothetical protein H0V18_09200 [Pyrinomonadaceae bacterium]|nr:hypothetical protein [Pyrinomonadaceae bacterium]
METDDTHDGGTWQKLAAPTARLLLKLEHHSDADHRDEKPKGQKDSDERAGIAAAAGVIKGVEN